MPRLTLAELVRDTELLREVVLIEQGCVHIWWRNDHAICGATQINHSCSPYPIVYWRDASCPSCGTPLCPFCRLLLYAADVR